MMTHGKQLAAEIKKRNHKTLVVFGGVHPTACPNTTLEDKNINIVCRGEGEETLYEVAAAVENDTPFSDIPGL